MVLKYYPYSENALLLPHSPCQSSAVSPLHTDGKWSSSLSESKATAQVVFVASLSSQARLLPHKIGSLFA